MSEVWPGAGIDFDWTDLQESDVDRVERHIDNMPDAETRLQWLEMFFIEFNYWRPKMTKDFEAYGPDTFVSAAMLAERAGGPPADPKNRVVKALWEICILSRNRWQRRQHLLGRAAAKMPEEIEGEPAASISLDGDEDARARQQVLAAFYLLEALDAPFDIHGKKKSIKELIAFLTGRHFKTVESALKPILDGNRRPEDLNSILPLFRNAELMQIAEKIKKEPQKE